MIHQVIAAKKTDDDSNARGLMSFGIRREHPEVVAISQCGVSPRFSRTLLADRAKRWPRKDRGLPNKLLSRPCRT